jgi:hypothetical protein
MRERLEILARIGYFFLQYCAFHATNELWPETPNTFKRVTFTQSTCFSTFSIRRHRIHSMIGAIISKRPQKLETRDKQRRSIVSYLLSPVWTRGHGCVKVG